MLLRATTPAPMALPSSRTIHLCRAIGGPPSTSFLRPPPDTATLLAPIQRTQPRKAMPTPRTKPSESPPRFRALSAPCLISPSPDPHPGHRSLPSPRKPSHGIPPPRRTTASSIPSLMTEPLPLPPRPMPPCTCPIMVNSNNGKSMTTPSPHHPPRLFHR
jgi:hypothetical protein